MPDGWESQWKILIGTGGGPGDRSTATTRRSHDGSSGSSVDDATSVTTRMDRCTASATNTAVAPPRRSQKDHWRKYGRRSYLKHKTKRIALNKRWRDANPERSAEYQRRARLKDPCGFLLRSTKGNAVRRGLVFSLGRAWLHEKLLFSRCEVTGLPFDPVIGTQYLKRPFSPSIDRVGLQWPLHGRELPSCRPRLQSPQELVDRRGGAHRRPGDRALRQEEGCFKRI